MLVTAVCRKAVELSPPEASTVLKELAMTMKDSATAVGTADDDIATRACSEVVGSVAHMLQMFVRWWVGTVEPACMWACSTLHDLFNRRVTDQIDPLGQA